MQGAAIDAAVLSRPGDVALEIPQDLGDVSTLEILNQPLLRAFEGQVEILLDLGLGQFVDGDGLASGENQRHSNTF